ncbi:hypothetical protein [Trueperella pyogenes]|uniref:hypothetical protein n=1 Tax=Trueperella pyogenes TaxID=1661 RepID=UPI0023DDE168|nr:hypothetical protein [Trueperella pyogenes]
MKDKPQITTSTAKVEDIRPDLVKCNFNASAPRRLWVADIAYVRAKKSFVYAASVTDGWMSVTVEK